jgi:DNA-binding response OmpR family regulator
MKILVCDDEPGIRRTLSQILTDEGYEVETVGLGQEALARAVPEASGFDAALLDVWLPDLDGLSVLDRLRAARLPVMISGMVPLKPVRLWKRGRTTREAARPRGSS